MEHIVRQLFLYPIVALWRRTPRRFGILCGCALIIPLILRGGVQLVRHRTLAVTGLPAAKRVITIKELTPSDFTERLRQIRSTSVTTKVRCQRLSLRALGFVQQVEPQLDITTTALSTALTGPTLVDAYYAAGTDTIYAVDPSASTVAHEWVHAIDDQYGRRMREAATAQTTDERMALRAAIEGTAITLLKSRPLIAPLSTDLDANSWILAYGIGPQYIGRSIEGNISRALQLTPQTSYEVLFGRRVAPLQIDPVQVSPTDHLLCSDQLGALGILTALRTATISSTEAWRIARAWRGDRLDMVMAPMDRRIVVWTVAFADTESASAWQRLMRPFTALHLDRSVDLRVIVGGQLHLSPFDRLDQ